ncbi:unnamed protein product [Fraxinus pennsylvanica]|uniref:Aminotransferase-like plant mobile domain-containing protein n=1 Tax=Fraxinus pennsylvanica TaxID=56036 RepID=A0AAD1YUZ0_9LAMI|nr:unnamed protein product [Fraxinus pennsylvanica]
MVIFNGWRCPQKDWIKLLDCMHSMHLSTWKQAEIYDAITNSTFQIHQNNDLIFEVAEKWCARTNTFLFPWGETTISLEDMMFLWSFSVLGDLVSSTDGYDKMDVTTKELLKAPFDHSQNRARKSTPFPWMVKFMDCGSKFEHEALLAHWLSAKIFSPLQFI